MSGISRSHCLIAAHGSMNEVTLCDMTSGGASHKLMGHTAAVWSCAWSSSSEWELISGGKDGQVRLWDIRRPGTRHVFDVQDDLPSSSLGNHGRDAARAHSGWVTGCISSPDGLFWGTTGNDGHFRLWNTETKRQVLRNYRKKMSKTKFPRGLSMVADGRTLFHPSEASIHVLDISKGTSLKVLSGGHFGQVYSCAWNDIEEHLYTCGADKNILVWAPCVAKFDQPEGTDSDGDAWSTEYAW